MSIDFVLLLDGDLIRAVDGDKFDYVIASHVVGACPKCFCKSSVSDISTILEARWFTFLIVPDKRFTFDVIRPETTFWRAFRMSISQIIPKPKCRSGL